VQFSELQKPLTLTLTLDRVIRHTIVHQSLRALCTHQISLKSEKKLFAERRTDVRTDVPT